MNDGVVYMPTLSRYESLARIIPAWLAEDIHVRLVVDPSEKDAHVAFRNDHRWQGLVSIAMVPFDNRGIGYKRRYCVTHAWNSGLEAIIMSDDDHRPDPDTCDVHMLIEQAAKPGVLGIGATVQIYERFTAGAIGRLSGPILWPGGAGFSVYGLNIETALEVGNFDAALHSFGEDAELRRQGLARGIPWLVHASVRVSAINQRNSPGGFMAKYGGDLAAREAAALECRALIWQRWPQYVSHPDKPPRMAWQKMLEDYFPGWRSLSALHGGHL